MNVTCTEAVSYDCGPVGTDPIIFLFERLKAFPTLTVKRKKKLNQIHTINKKSKYFKGLPQSKEPFSSCMAN